MIKHLTLLLFIGLAALSCEEESPNYIDCKWFAYSGWQEGDTDCLNYRQYTLGDSTEGYGFGYGYGVTIDNYISYYENDNYLKLGLKTINGDGIDFTVTIDFQELYDEGQNLCVDYEEK